MSETALILHDSPADVATEPQLFSEPRKSAIRFTRENARAYAAKGHATMRKRREEAAKAKAERESNPPQTEPEPGTELALVWAECNRISSILAGKVPVKDRLELGGLLDKLLDRMRIIRGQALPGTASSRAPAPVPSPVSRLLEAGSAPMIAPAARPARDEQE